jgi:hypothetical protein
LHLPLAPANLQRPNSLIAGLLSCNCVATSASKVSEHIPTLPGSLDLILTKRQTWSHSKLWVDLRASGFSSSSRWKDHKLWSYPTQLSYRERRDPALTWTERFDHKQETGDFQARNSVLAILDNWPRAFGVSNCCIPLTRTDQSARPNAGGLNLRLISTFRTPAPSDRKQGVTRFPIWVSSPRNQRLLSLPPRK